MSIDKLSTACKQILTIIHSQLVKLTNTNEELEQKLVEESSLTIINNQEDLCFFPPSDEINSSMSELTEQISTIVNGLHYSIDQSAYDYLLDFLYNFHFIDDRFTETISFDILPLFERELTSFLISLDAYKAAENGNITIIKDFLDNRPSLKDKPLLNGLTLLYVATANNHLSVLKYLLDEANCSINAQNQTDAPNGAAAATALHIACANGQSDLIRYLLEKGADCYIQNGAQETPTTNINNSPTVFDIFRQHLVIDYSEGSSNVTKLPKYPILSDIASNDESLFEYNCIWEYKLFYEKNWIKFTQHEAYQLNSSLKLKNEIYIDMTMNNRMYNISFMKFLKSGNEINGNENQSWIRCRGSSFYNFDIVPIWQFMLCNHPDIIDDEHRRAQFNILNIPIIFNRNQFNFHLNSWYSCDIQTIKMIDEAMNHRKRDLTIDNQFLGKITFNLELFSFTNQTQTIDGYIRWLPKFVIVDSKTKRITHIDNFQTIHLQENPPVPLTTKLLPESLTDTKTQLADEYVSNECIDNEKENEGEELEQTSLPPPMVSDTENSAENVVEDDKEQNLEPLIQSVIRTNEIQVGEEIELKQHELDKWNAAVKKHEIFVDEEQKKLTVMTTKTKDAEEKEKLLSILGAPTEQDDEFIAFQKQIDMQTKVLNQRNEELSELKETRRKLENQLEQTRDKLKRIQNVLQKEKQAVLELITLDYDIPALEHVPLQATIVQTYLRTLPFPEKNDHVEKYITIETNNHPNKENYYIWILKAHPIHHREMSAIINRVENLIRLIKSQQDYHERHLKRIVRTLFDIDVNPVMFRRRNLCCVHDWQLFTEIFKNLINDKRIDICKIFDVHIRQKAKSLVNDVIRNVHEWWKRLRTETTLFIQQNQILNSIEQLKRDAFRKFIEHTKDKIKTDQQPTRVSIMTRDKHLAKLEEILESEPIYRGHEVKHFCLIAPLLRRINIFCRSFQLQLPLFESSLDLLHEIDQHTVIAISTATGSGKSTLLPALLAASGYDKILVTQPRRLPCTLLSKRVNSSTGMSNISGWAVSGTRSKNARQAPVLYLTDGLLKEYLQYGEQNLIRQATNSSRGLVFFVDEVHERSINIDLCLGFLARFLKSHPQLHRKIKIIISSATLDPSISQLFHHYKFHVTQIQTTTLYKVNIQKSDENMISLIHQLNQKLQRGQQILCFVKSTSEVFQSIKLLYSLYKLKASPLVQSQSAEEQHNLIEHEYIFFSTTVAETSLTFPSLKYVIDTGVINMPVYNTSTDTTILQETIAAESTIKQRQGRLGRTQSGDYFALYKHDSIRTKYPTPQICQTELSHIEFSLRRSPLKCGLNVFKQWLPNSPNQQTIDLAIEHLCQLEILDPIMKNFTNTGSNIAQLPDFGSLAMAKAVLVGLQKYNCGRDLIRLAAILDVVNTSSILRSIPSQYKKIEGDFMTLLEIMDIILAQKLIQPPHTFNIDVACQQTGLSDIKHILKRAILRNSSFESFFNQSNKYRQASQRSSHGDWTQIARALLSGYSDNVYLSLRELQGKRHSFCPYIRSNQTKQQKMAVIDSNSTLARSVKDIPVSLVFARDIRYLTAIRAISILSFVGEIQAEWIDRTVERTIDLTDNEIKKLGDEILVSINFEQISNGIHYLLLNKQLVLTGMVNGVLLMELYIHQQLIVEQKISLIDENETDKNFKRNVENLMGMLHIFLPMKWRWEAEKQVKITFNKQKHLCEVIVVARDAQFQKVKAELHSFLGWLRHCIVMHLHSGIPPRLYNDITFKKRLIPVEDRIERITNSKLTGIELWARVGGPNATRESRMEVVAWTAMCKFDCKLEGGFIRDWIVNNESARPPSISQPSQWVHFAGAKNIPYLDKALIPSDLDCHLPIDRYFDIEKFLDEMYKFDIEVQVYREHWRYVLLFDQHQSTGPFTMDLIEPHIALTHDQIDIDVNNLYVKRDYCKELGQRVDLRQAPCSIDLEQIVDNIKAKQFQVLRPIDQLIQSRIDKMIARGWKQKGEPLIYIPPPQAKYKFVVSVLPSNTTLYKQIAIEMQHIPNVKILSMEQIRNPDVENTYESMKKLIAGQCPGNDPNERRLFHGTLAEHAHSIIEMGFDDRFFGSFGLYGHGAYFADNPMKSHGYNAPTDGTISRIMFYSKVTLGKEKIMNETDSSLPAAPRDHHSVRGHATGFTEYIVYRGAQALPYLKITYEV